MFCFIFDVDGTLTDVAKPINHDFEKFMLDFTRMHTCYICTGSDRSKTLNQLGIKLTNSFKKTFHCSGNHIYEKDKEIYKNDWQISKKEKDFLISSLKKSNYPEKTGKHLEYRTGTVNFSICGRNANFIQRQRFIEWDKETNFRQLLAKQYNSLFIDSEAVVGGQTSVDIFKKGFNKSRVINLIEEKSIFFGDMCYPGGNDYAISLASEKYYQVNNWQETFSILKNKYYNQ